MDCILLVPFEHRVASFKTQALAHVERCSIQACKLVGKLEPLQLGGTDHHLHLQRHVHQVSH